MQTLIQSTTRNSNKIIQSTSTTLESTLTAVVILSLNANYIKAKTQTADFIFLHKGRRKSFLLTVRLHFLTSHYKI